MKIALIGYGPMGQLLERMARERGHHIATIIDGAESKLSVTDQSLRLATSEVAIDFSAAAAVGQNVASCLAAKVPLVEGTTGWNEQAADIERAVRDVHGAMVFGANFSIGVNLFYRVTDFAAGLFAKLPGYEAFIEEQHHSGKKDAPSGTALKLKEIVAKHIQQDFSVSSTRSGSIPGTHRVGFDGWADQILLEHAARSREGFALGALLAAEWIIGKSGFYEFADVMDEIVGE